MRSVATALAIFMSVMHFNFPATQNIHTKIKTKTCEADLCDKEGFEFEDFDFGVSDTNKSDKSECY